MSFGDGISWEQHILELPLDDKDKLFYRHNPGDEMMKRIKGYVPKGKLLDCGCFIGRWIKFFEDAGFEYTGVDQSSDAIRVGHIYHPNGRFIHKFLWDMDFNEEFDVVVSIATLQHNTLDEKKRILPKIHRALKKDGIFLMAESTVLEETKTQLTYSGWINLAEQNGFRIVESWHPNELNINDSYLFRRL